MWYRRMNAAVLSLLAVLSAPRLASAAYILTPLSGGSNTVLAGPGDSFDLDLVLTSDASDQHNSVVFRVVFSDPGLLYTGYTWQLPYTSDFSRPDSDFPVLLDAASFDGAAWGYPADDVDVYLSNASEESFTTGTIATLHLTVPSDYSGPPTITISAAPDTIANGFLPVDTGASEDFILYVPEPSEMAALLLAVAVLLRHRVGGGSASHTSLPRLRSDSSQDPCR